jgi:ketosteroid isomerase-like protein
VTEFTPRSFTVNDDEVMVLLQFGMKSKETGREASMGLMHYWHFRAGKVDHYRGTEDTAATLAMLGK